MRSRAPALLLSLAFLALAACGPGAKGRPYPAPQPDALVTHLLERQNIARSFMAESRMEYWVDDQRIKPTVLVMGERGARVRFNALNPDAGSVAADLACDGSSFQFVDFNHDCQLTGPCSKSAIAQLLRVELEPDDFLLLAVGTVPVLDGPTATVEWDAKNQHEILSLTAPTGRKQKIVLDGRDQHWDVLSSTMWAPDGAVEWKLTNKDFSATKTEDDKSIRLPARTRFEQPRDKAELTIRWIDRQINAELDPEKFHFAMPDLKRCGS
jgi:hypothetical protein